MTDMRSHSFKSVPRLGDPRLEMGVQWHTRAENAARCSPRPGTRPLSAAVSEVLPLGRMPSPTEPRAISTPCGTTIYAYHAGGRSVSSLLTPSSFCK
jgi:hypothetical protein